MKIEVLYVPDCPYHPVALLRLREVLAAEGVAADISEVAVKDMATAKALRFGGSPTRSASMGAMLLRNQAASKILPCPADCIPVQKSQVYPPQK
jgi:hypothetical protein